MNYGLHQPLYLFNNTTDDAELTEAAQKAKTVSMEFFQSTMTDRFTSRSWHRSVVTLDQLLALVERHICKRGQDHKTRFDTTCPNLVSLLLVINFNTIIIVHVVIA